jgi:hypothetical protein
MATELIKSGIDVVGDMPWGSHFCQFYETKDDLLEVLIPYFTAGLESNEACLWIVSTLSDQEACGALIHALPDFERYFADQRVEVIEDSEWYIPGGSFDLNRVMRLWAEKHASALARGYSGIRVSADTFWLKRERWNEFDAYEEHINKFLLDLRMTCLCNYPLAASRATDILDVSRTHQFAVARRKGNWEVVETAELRQAKSEIKRLNEELEQRVVERTAELSAANEQLKGAVDEIDKLRRRLELENAYLQEEVRAASGSGTILGKSAGIRRVLEQIEMVAPTDATSRSLARLESARSWWPARSMKAARGAAVHWLRSTAQQSHGSCLRASFSATSRGRSAAP